MTAKPGDLIHLGGDTEEHLVLAHDGTTMVLLHIQDGCSRSSTPPPTQYAVAIDGGDAVRRLFDARAKKLGSNATKVAIESGLYEAERCVRASERWRVLGVVAAALALAHADP